MMTSDEAVQWAQGVWQPFALTWQPATVAPGQARLRVSGKSDDRNTLIDVTIGPRTRRVVEVSIAVPIYAEADKATAVARFIAFTLAAVCDSSLSEADAWLGETMRKLKREQPSRVTGAFKRRPVGIATAAAGILAVQIRSER